jgi:hypothetical protein
MWKKGENIEDVRMNYSGGKLHFLECLDWFKGMGIVDYCFGNTCNNAGSINNAYDNIKARKFVTNRNAPPQQAMQENTLPLSLVKLASANFHR